MSLWQRILLRLGIASTQFVAEDNVTLLEYQASERKRLVAWQRRVVSDLIQIGYNVSPQCGNHLKANWNSWLQNTAKLEGEE